MAEKIVAEDVNPEQLINELNKTFDSLEAELKPPPNAPAKEQDDDDKLSLEDDSNVITSCKKHLMALLRWPPSCAMPNKTSKPKKGKQGIKDLGNKDGRLLLIALQNGDLKFVKADPTKIKNNEIAVIATAEPTTDDAATHPVYTISSDSDHISSAPTVNLPPSSNKAGSPTANNQPPPLPLTQQPRLRKHMATVDPDSDLDDPSVHKKTVQPPPFCLVKRQALKKHVVIVASDAEDKEVSDTKKRPRLSPEASKDPFGSGDDYMHDHNDESESGMVTTPQSCRTWATKCKRFTKGKDASRAKANVQTSAQKAKLNMGMATNTTTSKDSVTSKHAMTLKNITTQADTVNPVAALSPPLPHPTTVIQADTANPVATTSPADSPASRPVTTVQAPLATAPSTNASLPHLSASMEATNKLWASNNPQLAPCHPRTRRDPVDSFPPLRHSGFDQFVNHATNRAAPGDSLPSTKHKRSASSITAGQVPVATASTTDASMPHFATSTKVGTNKLCASSDLQLALHHPRTGEDIVDSFPPLRHSGFGQFVNHAKNRPPPPLKSTDVNNMQSNRAAMPVSYPESERFDAAIVRRPLFTFFFSQPCFTFIQFLCLSSQLVKSLIGRTMGNYFLIGHSSLAGWTHSHYWQNRWHTICGHVACA
ncbi:hypothetical protein C0993_012017 [Termitomyces sp. T159_Od127]|nr:hypothetical protein C0993_012017 [Termitomyces sp. T159_Od127]